MSNEPEAPKDDTMRWEQTVRDEPTEQLDTENIENTGNTAHETNADVSAWPPAEPERPSGPHAPAIVLGLVCLAVAGIVLAEELGTLTVDWGDVGPIGIVGAGALLVVFGLLGLLSSRRTRS